MSGSIWPSPFTMVCNGHSSSTRNTTVRGSVTGPISALATSWEDSRSAVGLVTRNRPTKNSGATPR